MLNTKITKGNSDIHRDQLIRDMIYVCSIDGLSKRTRREFLDKCISWPFSDYSDDNIEKSAKLKGCKFWSEAALEEYTTYLKCKKEKKLESNLRHEHVVPRRIFINAMVEYFSDKYREKLGQLNSVIDLQNELNAQFVKMKNLMNETLIGCVVTKDEAAKIDAGENKSKEFQSAMPLCAYEDNIMPKTAFEKLSKIIKPWARYTRLKKEIVIKEITWTPKSQGWKDDYDIKNENVLLDK